MTISRRSFLAAAGLSCVFGSDLLQKAWSLVAAQQDCALIPRWSPPVALETPISAHTSWITPTECFYVFNHGELPPVDGQRWNIAIDGVVDRPVSLSLPDLKHLTQVEVTNTLECAGNGRAFFQPAIGGVPWTRGAVGNAVFGGPRLRDVLSLARPRKEARHVAFTGVDVASSAGQPFVRSIPLEKALDPNTVLAMTMNGKPLNAAHGFPIRALVPGWIGAASVKRVNRIQLLQEEAHGDFMQRDYRLSTTAGAKIEGEPPSSVALTSLLVKSIIWQISGSRRLRRPITIAGAAWAGESAISKVEVSTDSGENWEMAHLRRHAAKYAWTLWEYRWTPLRKGQTTILVRATDSAGHTQPETPNWNPRGYLWNGYDRAPITIA